MKRIVCLLMAAALLMGGCNEQRRQRAEAPAVESSVPSADNTPAEESSIPVMESVPVESPHESEPTQEEGPLVEILKLSIPEGYTLARVGMTLEEMGICTTEEFIAAAQTGDFSGYPLAAAQVPDPNRCFTLEGYLFPATYDIYSSEGPDAILRRILDHTESRITSELREQIAATGYTVDQILTIASIIEKEAFGHEHMPAISSVLHNRLELGMMLQCDVTITYVEGAIKPFITGDIDRYNEHYNTYKCAALPAGPICNPSMDAIRAAISPMESDYLFFLTDADKNYYFTSDYEEHKANIKKAGIELG